MVWIPVTNTQFWSTQEQQEMVRPPVGKHSVLVGDKTAADCPNCCDKHPLFVNTKMNLDDDKRPILVNSKQQEMVQPPVTNKVLVANETAGNFPPESNCSRPLESHRLPLQALVWKSNNKHMMWMWCLIWYKSQPWMHLWFIETLTANITSGCLGWEWYCVGSRTLFKTVDSKQS